MGRARAKSFQGGDSQTIRLPKDAWPASFQRCLGVWSAPIERPRQGVLKHLRDPKAVGLQTENWL